MNSDAAKKSSPQGMNVLTKDRFEIGSKAVAIIGGLISAIVLILTMQNGTEQRARELRWNQAKLAMELVDDMMSDAEAFNALRMIDWEEYEYQVEGEKVMITSQEVREALKVENNTSLTPNGIIVRESFDKLFYHMGKIERSLESNLIRFEDVRSPMEYYAPFLRSTYGDVVALYMRQLHHNDALEFMNRFHSAPEP
ncbi:MAG TPA: hypothetical protein VNI02_22260 [Blastocatellia bacterium]|jgi:hypothetical protein|nr:hypothetical protein [Blastocatellia bacterium]